MRRDPTPAERLAWQHLRDRRLLGLKFRRQVVIAGYIVDFYCPSERIVVEIEGDVHDDPIVRARDTRRFEVFAAMKLRVVRVANEDVARGAIIDSVAAIVAKTDTWARDRGEAAECPSPFRERDEERSDGG